MNYVVGFAFDHGAQRVLLVRKTHPEWQAGKLNGIGGKIDKGETPHFAMVREFEEETGLKTHMNDWSKFLVLYNDEVEISFFTAVLPTHVLIERSGRATDTDETLIVPWVDQVNNLHPIDNIKWILPLAAQSHKYELMHVEFFDGQA